METKFPSLPRKISCKARCSAGPMILKALWRTRWVGPSKV
jgi:hypothetical protein